MPDKKLEGDRARKSKMKIHGTRKVAKDSFGLFPMASYRGGHVTVEKANNGRDVGARHVGTT